MGPEEREMKIRLSWSVSVGVLVSVGLVAGCDGAAPIAVEQSVAAVTVSSANLALQELSNSCGANQTQTFFKVTNNGSTPVTVSDITIKYWVYDASGSNVVPQVYTGGCLLDGYGSCVHQVTGVTATATKFTPACGSDANHQANWEITISNTDRTALGAGLTWSNIQAALHLANWGNFNPGLGKWYTGCVPGSAYAPSAHSAVYAQGNLVTASTGVPPVCRAPHGTQQLSGEVPPAVATAPLVGPLLGTVKLALGIGLPLRNQTALRAVIDDISNPLSPNYRTSLTTAQFASGYGPLQADYDAVTAFASANGLTLGDPDPVRNLIVVTGTVAAIEKAFFVTLNLYKRPDGTVFFAPANEPSLNLTPALLHISGLDSYSLPRPANGGTGPGYCNPDPSSPSYVGSDFKNIYLADAPGVPCASALDGTGQSVALLEFTDYYDQGITDYTQAYLPTGTTLNLTRVVLPTAARPPLPGPLTVSPTCGAVLAAFFPGWYGYAWTPAMTAFYVGLGCGSSHEAVTSTPTAIKQWDAQSEGEVALDIEMVAAVAPKAHIYVYEWNITYAAVAPATTNSVLLKKIATDNLAKAISSSWTWGDVGSAPDLNIPPVFLQYAAQGQTFFQASGDLGSYIPTGPRPNVQEPIILTDLMTVVGGTQLTTTGTGASLAYASETAWNDLSERPGNSVSGGGFCNGYGLYSPLPLPGYQAGLGKPFPALSELAFPENTEVTTNPQNARMIPDVAMVADQLSIFSSSYFENPLNPNDYYLVSPMNNCTAGTSAAAPLWAAITALANQANPTLGSVGFANPTLYNLARTGAFHDIADGSNNSYYTAAPNSYHATTAYDLATGLGTPNGCGVIKNIECISVPTDGTAVLSNQIYGTGTTVRITVAGEVEWGGCDPVNCPLAGACGFMRYGDAYFHVDTCFNAGNLMHAPEFNYPIQLYMDGGPLPTQAFQPSHVYDYTINGNGGKFSFSYNDILGDYPDNKGNFSVCISTP